MQITNPDFRSILQEHWGYDDFRGIQRDIIESICAGRDTLGLMPTGGGKSITFQVPALASEGICIVITPLIALMKDQVSHLRQKGIKATCIHMGLSHQKVLTQLDNCLYGNYKLLYISPERIASELFQVKLSHMRVSFICVDEAHCISQWGYDFRQSYLQIKEIRRIVPDAPILALTATATPPVITDIQRQLEFKHENVFRMSFERQNLAYLVQKAEVKEEAIRQLLNVHEGSAIVYTRNRERTKEFADQLQQWGFSATYYHAGLSDAEKDQRQQSWQHDKTRIMVATNAFGMGIDKPDVRLVLHLGVPDSIESYFQEAGRAGRDGLSSKAILLYNDKDLITLRKRVNETYPEKDLIRAVYEEVCCYLQIAIGYGMGMRREFNLDDFCRKFHRFPTLVESCLRILTKAGYIDYTDADEGVSRIMINYTRDDLYRLQNTDKNTDLVLNSLFRSVPGLFVRPMPMDEALVAKQTGLTSEQVYNLLKSLNKRGILTYIPRKNIPHVTFTRERRDLEYIRFTKEVYEDRKDNLAKRIDAMIGYITTDDTCRNRILLNYFGEQASKDCGQCDICMANAEAQHPATTVFQKLTSLITGQQDTAQQQYQAQLQHTKDELIRQITEAGSIHPFLLNLDDLDPDIAKEALQQLTDEGTIITDDAFRIRLNVR